MTCTSPLWTWQDTDTGEFVFDNLSTFRPLGPRFPLPCGKCMSCRIARSSEWALRCMHERAQHSEACFITLTLSDPNFPESQDAWLSEYQRFMKRLRKHRPGVRSFGCLELGESTLRPHGHGCLFGVDFSRDEPMARGHSGEVAYRSDELDSLWGLGHASVGDLTPQSAGYVARYALKKRTTGGVLDVVPVPHPITGELVSLTPSRPWAVSTRPGIGAGWFDRYGVSQVEQGFVVGPSYREQPVPRYYRKLARRLDPLIGSDAAASRELLLADPRYYSERTPERLAAQDTVLRAKVRSLSRSVV